MARRPRRRRPHPRSVHAGAADRPSHPRPADRLPRRRHGAPPRAGGELVVQRRRSDVDVQGAVRGDLAGRRAGDRAGRRLHLHVCHGEPDLPLRAADHGHQVRRGDRRPDGGLHLQRAQGGHGRPVDPDPAGASLDGRRPGGSGPGGGRRQDRGRPVPPCDVHAGQVRRPPRRPGVLGRSARRGRARLRRVPRRGEDGRRPRGGRARRGRRPAGRRLPPAAPRRPSAGDRGAGTQLRRPRLRLRAVGVGFGAGAEGPGVPPGPRLGDRPADHHRPVLRRIREPRQHHRRAGVATRSGLPPRAGRRCRATATTSRRRRSCCRRPATSRWPAG